MLDVQSLIKYLLEGLAVAAAAYYIPRKTSNLQEIAIIAITAAATFAVLDQFAPSVSSGARQGAGFGIGYNITSGLEGFDCDMEAEAEAAQHQPQPQAPPQPIDDSDDSSEESCGEEAAPFDNSADTLFSSVL